LTVALLKPPRVQLPTYLVDDAISWQTPVAVYYVLQMLRLSSPYIQFSWRYRWQFPLILLVLVSLSSLSVAEPVVWNNLLASLRSADIDF
jgi:hypothetical protein